MNKLTKLDYLDTLKEKQKDVKVQILTTVYNDGLVRTDSFVGGFLARTTMDKDGKTVTMIPREYDKEWDIHLGSIDPDNMTHNISDMVATSNMGDENGPLVSEADIDIYDESGNRLGVLNASTGRLKEDIPNKDKIQNVINDSLENTYAVPITFSDVLAYMSPYSAFHAIEMDDYFDDKDEGEEE